VSLPRQRIMLLVAGSATLSPTPLPPVLLMIGLAQVSLRAVYNDNSTSGVTKLTASIDSVSICRYVRGRQHLIYATWPPSGPRPRCRHHTHI